MQRSFDRVETRPRATPSNDRRALSGHRGRKPIGNPIGTLAIGCALAACLVVGGLVPASAAAPSSDETTLRPAARFADIEDRAERSRALFVEAAKVFLHPRCANCHPAGDTPMQLDGRVHVPPVYRADDGSGVAAMHCQSCHQEANVEHARVPGAPHWSLAPLSMAWLGKTPRQVCEQLKDRSRNGDRSLEEVHHHVAEDALVAWGWNPGPGREPAPGDQQTLAALVAAWIETGAHCPPETGRNPDAPSSATAQEAQR